jgi:hypothetical protein
MCCEIVQYCKNFEVEFRSECEIEEFLESQESL